MEGLDYDAAARTVKIEDIASNRYNRNILRKLKDNDPNFVRVLCADLHVGCDDHFVPEGARDLGWLGHFIGKNTTLKELGFQANIFRGISQMPSAFEKFFRGVNSNRSIQKVMFSHMDLSGGEIFQSLNPFFGNNGNLSEVMVHQCGFGPGCARQVALALRGCSKSLKHIKISCNQLGDEPLTEIIDPMSLHPQLEELNLMV